MAIRQPRVGDLGVLCLWIPTPALSFGIPSPAFLAVVLELSGKRVRPGYWGRPWGSWLERARGVFSRWTDVGWGLQLGLSQVVSQAWQDLKCFSLNLGFPEQEPEGSPSCLPPSQGPRQQ